LYSLLMDEIAQQFADILDNDPSETLDDRDVMNELFGNEEEPFGEEAEEVPDRQIKILNPGGDDDITKVKKPKRVLLKLDLDKLFSDRGLSAIPNHIKPLKFRGKGHELEDITNICKAYEHWAHRLYPKMTFKDVIEKVENLGLKNRKKCFNKRMEIYEESRRMALVTGKENGDEDDDEAPQYMEEDTDSGLFGEALREPAPPPDLPPPTETPSLSSEQIERMRQNRIRALDRKKQRESGIGANNSLEMSPLARSGPNVSSSQIDQSPDSDYQAPSKRFKPDFSETMTP